MRFLFLLLITSLRTITIIVHEMRLATVLRNIS